MLLNNLSGRQDTSKEKLDFFATNYNALEFTYN